MGGPFLNVPTAENVPTVLLYSFTPKEQGNFETMLRGFPGIRLIAVPEPAYNLSIKDVLIKPLPAANVNAGFSRHMLVFAHIPDPLVQPIIAICKKATPEKVLKAMLTETNQNWSAQTLYQNLLEEEAQLGG